MPFINSSEQIGTLPTEAYNHSTIEINNIKNALNIIVKGKEKGNVSVQIFDLLGNNILSREYYKNSSEVIFPLDLEMPTGVYYCKASLNNHFFTYKKILIIN
jgi:hypothetical protein